MSQYLIIDDHPLIAEAIDYFVRKHVGDYDQLVLKSCEQLELWLEKGEFVDFIILDLHLNDGLTGSYVKDLMIKTDRLIIYSAEMENDDIRNWIDAGAFGIISKSDSLADLKAAFESNSVTTFLSHRIKDQLLAEVNKKKIEKENEIKLSKREQEVLKLVLEDKKNQEIAESLFISIKTVESHKRNIFTKYEVRSAIGLMQKLKS
ncbi:MAG: response regulator transcription factor [Flavobacteriales bacterium]|nr:response regulator transcription factor [Flavobacteriales bacterium]MDG1767768.1 response regulator transcription factor [Flavobacteriales bacterium]